MTVQLANLDGLGKTAWLTAYCHHKAGETYALRRPVSDWLIDAAGPPPFAVKIAMRTLHGVAMRALTMDTWLDECLQTHAPNCGPLTVMSLGCGFDSRWFERLSRNGSIARWIEVDREHVLRAKQSILAQSPFMQDYTRVERRVVDLTGDIGALAEDIEGPVIVIAEGVLDYLPLADRRRVLSMLRQRLDLKGVILDAQNAIFQRLANMEAEKNTGDKGVRFVGSPMNPTSFLSKIGLNVKKRKSPMPALAAISSTLPERAAIKLVPVIRNGYQFLWLT